LSKRLHRVRHVLTLFLRQVQFAGHGVYGLHAEQSITMATRKRPCMQALSPHARFAIPPRLARLGLLARCL
jgi:hypothetical protein